MLTIDQAVLVQPRRLKELETAVEDLRKLLARDCAYVERIVDHLDEMYAISASDMLDQVDALIAFARDLQGGCR